MPLLAWLTRWEGKWIKVYSADADRDNDGDVIPFQGKLLTVGHDFIHARQSNGFEVVFSARSIWSVGLVTDQDKAELEAIEKYTERKESHVDR